QVEQRAQMRDPVGTMAFVTAIVLLVACANVAGLLLAPGAARVREVCVRAAIGAPRRRIVRQLLTEALLLAFAGAALGVALAQWFGGALVPALGSGAATGHIPSGTNAAVLVFAVLCACGSAVLFGLVPA